MKNDTRSTALLAAGSKNDRSSAESSGAGTDVMGACGKSRRPSGIPPSRRRSVRDQVCRAGRRDPIAPHRLSKARSDRRWWAHRRGPLPLPMGFRSVVDHVALAPANRRHVGRDGTRHRAELRSVMRQMRNPRAPNLILAGQAGNIGAGAPDPPALDDGSPTPRSRHMPSQ